MIQRFAGRTLFSPFLSFFPPLRMEKAAQLAGHTRVTRFRPACTHAYYNCGYVLRARRPAKRTRANNGVAVAQLLIVARVHVVEQTRGERGTFFTRDFVRAFNHLEFMGKKKFKKVFSFDCKIERTIGTRFYCSRGIKDA